MSETLASIRYARALFEISRKEDCLAETEAWLSLFEENAKRHPRINALMQNPSVSDAEKFTFLDKILPGDTLTILKNFLRVLIEKKRFALLGEIRQTFHALYDRHRGSLEVVLISAVPLSEAARNKLKETLAAKLGSSGGTGSPKEIHLVQKTEPSLIGGFILRFDGKEIDCSFKKRFREIEQQLLAQ